MLKIDFPLHGMILNHRHGRQDANGLRITVTGEAPLRDEVSINGVPATRQGLRFSCEVVLREKESDLVALSEGPYGQHEHRVRVVWDRFSRPRYRFSIDDNSFFLRDIFQHNYASLFDCFYLKSLRDLNARYGTKFTLNIYYTTGDDFSLPQFPDRYKGEWADCAHWLKLAFHAYANDPDRPYQYAPAEKLAHDFDLVASEIHRFAGEQSYAPPTVIHWGMVQPASLKVLTDRGVKVLSGFFGWRPSGHDVHYFLDDDRCAAVHAYGALKDFSTGIIFSDIAIVCNNTPLDQVRGVLEPLGQDPRRAEIMDFFTHEQYFWPFYQRYLPDHAQRLEAAIAWATEKGYAPVFYHEGLLGGEE